MRSLSARSYVARQLVALGGQPVYREGFVTDNGNLIYDVRFEGGIPDDPREYAEYMRIFEANKDQLTDPDKIKPGQVLKIPAADRQLT